MRYKWCTFTFRKLFNIDHIDFEAKSVSTTALQGMLTQQDRRGGTPKDLAGSLLQELQTCTLFQTKQSDFPSIFRHSTDNDRILSQDAFSILYLIPDQISLVKG